MQVSSNELPTISNGLFFFVSRRTDRKCLDLSVRWSDVLVEFCWWLAVDLLLDRSDRLYLGNLLDLLLCRFATRSALHWLRGERVHSREHAAPIIQSQSERIPSAMESDTDITCLLGIVRYSYV